MAFLDLDLAPATKIAANIGSYLPGLHRAGS
jgi:hypothetical protein